MSAVSALRRSPVLLVRSAESRCTSREEKRYDAVSASLTARSSIRSNGSVPSLRQSGFCLRHAPSLSVTKRYGPVPSGTVFFSEPDLTMGMSSSAGNALSARVRLTMSAPLLARIEATLAKRAL